MNLRHTVLLAFVPLILLLTPAPATESDNLWAEAIFSSMPNTNMTTRQTEGLFLKALQKADAKGPIYVSLGDYYSGPAPMALAAHSMSRQIQENVGPDIEKQAEALAAPDGKPSDAEIERVAGAMSSLINESFKKHVRGLEAAITGPQSQALRYYFAAVAEDPKLAVAWFRIATSQQANDKLQHSALSNFLTCDPENALPHYLQAFESLDREQLPAALLSVQNGNRKPLRIPRTPMPTRFNLAFPDTKPYRDADIAGTPVTPAVFRTYAMVNDSFPSMGLNVKFRNLARGLVKHAGVLKANGKQDEGIRCLESVATLGLNLIRNDDRDTVLALIGLAISGLAAEDLAPLYEATKQQEKIKNLKAFATARDQYMSEYSKFLNSSSELWSSEDASLKILKEIEKHQRKEVQLVTELRKKTGLSTFSFEE